MGKHVDRIKNALAEAKGVVGKIDLAKNKVIIEVKEKLNALEILLEKLAETVDKLQEKVEKLDKKSDKKADKKADKEENKKEDDKKDKE